MKRLFSALDQVIWTIGSFIILHSIVYSPISTSVRYFWCYYLQNVSHVVYETKTQKYLRFWPWLLFSLLFFPCQFFLFYIFIFICIFFLNLCVSAYAQQHNTHFMNEWIVQFVCYYLCSSKNPLKKQTASYPTLELMCPLFNLYVYVRVRVVL